MSFDNELTRLKLLIITHEFQIKKMLNRIYESLRQKAGSENEGS